MARNTIYIPAFDYTLPFVKIDGVIDLPGTTLRPIEKGVVDGIAFKRNGRRAKPSVLTTTGLAANLSIALSLESDYHACKGKQIVVYDCNDTEYAWPVVIDVRLVRKQRVIRYKWAGTAYLLPYILTAEWVVQYPYGTA